MPILQIKALPQKSPEALQKAIRRTNQAIAEAYGCEQRHVRTIWEEIKPGCYLEGDEAREQQPADTHPPVGQLLCFEGKDQVTIEKTLLAASQAISSELGLPGNVFISYAEAKSGRAVAGDALLRK